MFPIPVDVSHPINQILPQVEMISLLGQQGQSQATNSPSLKTCFFLCPEGQKPLWTIPARPGQGTNLVLLYFSQQRANIHHLQALSFVFHLLSCDFTAFTRDLKYFLYHGLGHSVMFDLLQHHGLQPARLLRPQDSPGKNTGAGCHFLLQGILPTQGSNLLFCESCIGWQVLYHQCHLGNFPPPCYPMRSTQTSFSGHSQ